MLRVCAHRDDFRGNRKFLYKQSTKFSVKRIHHGDSGENLLQLQVFQFGWSAPLVKEKYSPLPDRNTGVLLVAVTFENVEEQKMHSATRRQGVRNRLWTISQFWLDTNHAAITCSLDLLKVFRSNRLPVGTTGLRNSACDE